MSTTTSSLTSINSSGGLTTSSTLTNALGTLQESGLASGVNSTAIIQAELAVEEEPMTNIEDEITGLTSEDTQLSTIESYLQAVSNDAQALSKPSLFANVQTVSSTNSSLVSATGTGSIGAVVGSNTITVSQLASAASRTFVYSSPSSATTISIDGSSVAVSAGESAATLASAINSSNSLDVYATTATDSSGNTELVLSSRTTGAQTSDGYINVNGATGLLSENTSLASAGQNAEYSINGGSLQSSATDTVTNAIAGITLNLEGVTGSNPITITASTPAPSSSAIISAVEQFVNDYNSTLYVIESAIDTAPASETTASAYNPNSGSLFGDDELENLLSDLRDTLGEAYGSGSSTYTILSQLGISTGASTGAATTDATDGYLTVNTDTLSAAISSNSSSVKSLLQSWSTSFQSVTNAAAASTTGAIANRISGNGELITGLQSRYTAMQEAYNTEEKTMVEQWAQVESTLEDLSTQKTSLTTFSTELENENSSSN